MNDDTAGLPAYQPPDPPGYQPPRRRSHWFRNWVVIPAACLVGVIVLVAVVTVAAGSGKGHPGAAGAAYSSSPATSKSAPAVQNLLFTDPAGGTCAPAKETNDGYCPGDAPAPAATPTPAKTSPPATHSVAPAPKPRPRIIAKFSGSGIQNTASFVTPDSWHLSYWFSCANFGQAGNFQVYEYSTDGSLDDVLVNDLSMGRGPVATYKYGDAGTHYLQLNSECNWQVVVVAG